jgi:cytochrome b561
MIAQYLILAMVLAVTLNHPNRLVRSGGTLLAAIGLGFIVLSIYLADTDGTFASAPVPNLRPVLLKAQAAVALVAIGFLLWAAWGQLHRRSVARVPWKNTAETFGLVSRYAHWATATLVLCMIPIGLFLQVLRPGAPIRGGFIDVHETLGLFVLGLVVLRRAWLAASPAPPADVSSRPWERRLAHAVHLTLYVLILSMPLTGIMLALSGGSGLTVLGFPVTRPGPTGMGAPWRALHDVALPLVFYGVFALHLGAVLAHHFVRRRTGAVRRMLS